MAYTAGDTILDDEYNTFATGNAAGTGDNGTANLNTLWGTGTGDYGYGETGSVIAAVSAHNVCIWISAPCKGGSKWNQHNWCTRPELRPHILELVNEFVFFISYVIRILRAVKSKGYDPII